MADVETTTSEEDRPAHLPRCDRGRRGPRGRIGSHDRFRCDQDREDRISRSPDRRCCGLGLPGLYGCEIWAEKVNAAGGVKIGDDTTRSSSSPTTTNTHPRRAGPEPRSSFSRRRQVHHDAGRRYLAGGAADRQQVGMLVSTLLPSDLSPDTTTLIAPCEVHPIYNVTGVWWLADQMPDLKFHRICAQDDALGRPRWRPTSRPSRRTGSMSSTLSSSIPRPPTSRR